MSFAGHVFDMINRIKANESHKKARRERRQHVMNAYRTITASTMHQLKKDSLTNEELQQVKMKIRKKLIKDRRVSLLKDVLSVVISLLILILIVYLAEKMTGYKII